MVTRKGQMTIPAPVRKALGLKRGDKVAVVVDKAQARFVRADSPVKRTAGVFKGLGTPLTVEKLRESAEKAIAEEARQRVGD